MVESHVEWEAELGGGAVGCWDGAGAEKTGVGGARASGRSLRPPPLFRSISPTGVSAGLPPHRRLRAMFRRSRAVLPSDTGAVAPPRVLSDALSQTRGLADPPARARNLSTTPPPTSGPPHQAAPVDTHLRTGTALSRQCSGRPCLQPIPSPRTHREREGSWGGAGAVTHAGQGNDPGGGGARVQERKVKKRRRKRERRREMCPGDEGRGFPAQRLESVGDRALCSWLESLGLTDSEKDTPTVTATANHLSRTLQEGTSVKRRADPGERGAEPNRRDRRPYFLPPISQSGSLLGVPLLLPENSPPPSPCGSPNDSMFPLPVPRLQPLPPKRK